jgi:hypothetical protein
VVQTLVSSQSSFWSQWRSKVYPHTTQRCIVLAVVAVVTTAVYRFVSTMRSGVHISLVQALKSLQSPSVDMRGTPRAQCLWRHGDYKMYHLPVDPGTGGNTVFDGSKLWYNCPLLWGASVAARQAFHGTFGTRSSIAS